MDVNFKDALTILYRALPAVLFRAGIFAAGGFMIIVMFGILAFASHLAGSLSPAVVIVASFVLLPGAWLTGRIVDRFFLYRSQAAMLLMFSGRQAVPTGLSPALGEVVRFFPNYSPWAAVNRDLRRRLVHIHRSSDGFAIAPDAQAGTIGLLAAGPLSQAVLALAFTRGGTDAGRAVREGLALFLRHGMTAGILTRRWLGFSAAGFFSIFLCLALPNWFFFSSAGAPVGIGIALAVVIAWLLHRAFIVPFALAGVSAALLSETRNRIPDPELCEKLAALFPDATPAGER